MIDLREKERERERERESETPHRYISEEFHYGGISLLLAALVSVFWDGFSCNLHKGEQETCGKSKKLALEKN